LGNVCFEEQDIEETGEQMTSLNGRSGLVADDPDDTPAQLFQAEKAPERATVPPVPEGHPAHEEDLDLDTPAQLFPDESKKPDEAKGKATEVASKHPAVPSPATEEPDPSGSPQALYDFVLAEALKRYPQANRGRPSGRDLEATALVLSLLKEYKCRDAETARAWARWYVRNAMPDPLSTRGFPTVNLMHKTWHRFARWRPRPDNTLTPPTLRGGPVA
jgi:hypothetical protein